MKKLFSLLIFLIVAFFSNTMMSFAMEDMSMEMKIGMNISDCYDYDESGEKDFNHDCCYESEGISNISSLNNTRENNKKQKIKVKHFLDIFSLSLKSFENKNLTKITSPPYEERNIKNYSYKDLTKIIKSNT